MAGLWTLSFNQWLDANGQIAVGTRATFYQAGTTTPIVTYKNYGLDDPHPNPVETDDNARWPAVYLDEDDEFFDVRITTRTGFALAKFEGIPIIGPSGGGGGGGGPEIDGTGLLVTGDVKKRYATGPHTGWVRMNGRTIGNVVSGASERANADTADLFAHLWNVDTALVVSSGRGANPAADYAANKTIALPDMRGRSAIGLGSMGATASGRISALGLRKDPNAAGTPVVAAADKLGDTFGIDSVLLTEAQLAAHNHSMENAGNHRHEYDRARLKDNGPLRREPSFGTTSDIEYQTQNTGQDGSHKHTINDAGGGAKHANMPPVMNYTFYIKL